MVYYMSFESKPNNLNKNTIKADFIRHGKANYDTYRSMVASDKPDQAFNPKEQIPYDLDREGSLFAKEEAKKYFDKIDPENEELFFVSSNEARAIDTAGIFYLEATKKNFEILKPENSRDPVESLDKDFSKNIRIINELSTNYKQAIVSSLIQSKDNRRPINWSKINDNDIDLYKKIEKIIDEDDRGTFAANLVAHGDEIKKYIPEFKTAEDLYNENFKNLIKLFKFAEHKNRTSDSDKKLRILAFGHENQVLFALNKYFDEQNIKNCEILSIELDPEGKIKGSFRGKESPIDAV